MTDAALDNAHTRRGALAAEINVLQQRLERARRELQLVDEFIARWHTFASLDEGEALIRPDSPVDKSDTEARKGRPTNPSRAVVGDVVESLLRTWGSPASRATLFHALPANGIEIHGTNPEMVFSTMLWRLKDRFVRIPGKGYWFAGEPVPGQSGDLIGDD